WSLIEPSKGSVIAATVPGPVFGICCCLWKDRHASARASLIEAKCPLCTSARIEFSTSLGKWMVIIRILLWFQPIILGPTCQAGDRQPVCLDSRSLCTSGHITSDRQ